jgi:hypothetical protein
MYYLNEGPLKKINQPFITSDADRMQKLDVQIPGTWYGTSTVALAHPLSGRQADGDGGTTLFHSSEYQRDIVSVCITMCSIARLAKDFWRASPHFVPFGPSHPIHHNHHYLSFENKGKHLIMKSFNILLLLVVLGTSSASVKSDESIRMFQKSGYVETSTPGRIVSLSRRSIAFYSEAALPERLERGVLVGSAFVQKPKKSASH